MNTRVIFTLLAAGIVAGAAAAAVGKREVPDGKVKTQELQRQKRFISLIAAGIAAAAATAAAGKREVPDWKVKTQELERQKRFFLTSAAVLSFIGFLGTTAKGKREFVPGETISSNGLDALKGLNRTLVDGLVKGEILKEAVMEEILEEIVAEKILEEMAEVKILEKIIKENILKKKVEESGEGKITPGAKEGSERSG